MLLKEGIIKKNKVFVKILMGIVEYGVDYFYIGELVEKIVKVVNIVSINLGKMMLEDLVNYMLKECDFVCGVYCDKNICGMVLLSLGGINVF